MEIFRAYDIRGEYPKDINEEITYKIARILVQTFNAKKVIIGRDIGLASPKIYKALIKGSLEQGANVYKLGIVSTDLIYFAANYYKSDIAFQVTASHLTNYLTGIKILGPGVTPFGKGLGMEKLKENYLRYKEIKPIRKGISREKNVWKNFINQVLTFVDLKKIKSLKVVVDASNSVGSLAIDNLEKHLPMVKFIKLNWKLDGHYPGHPPNPFLKENREQLVTKVKEVKANLGVAFDGDADRIYFIDENGDYIFGVYINALIAEKMSKKKPRRVILYDVRAIRYIKKKIIEAGGIPKMELIGHNFFKNRMKKENALFGAEVSGHIYYNFGDYVAENSLIAFCQILEIISESNKSLSELTKDGRKNFPVSGEYNFLLPNFTNKILDKIRKKYSNGKISDFDTLTIYYPDWNFNLRPSVNEPVLRFNAEAINREVLLKKQEEVFKLLKAEGCQYLNDSGVTL